MSDFQAQKIRKSTLSVKDKANLMLLGCLTQLQG
jgi:hypothetical protein